jgi:hypothetical protein
LNDCPDDRQTQPKILVSNSVAKSDHSIPVKFGIPGFYIIRNLPRRFADHLKISHDCVYPARVGLEILKVHLMHVEAERQLRGDINYVAENGFTTVGLDGIRREQINLHPNQLLKAIS